MTARERLDLLLDKGSFREMDVFVTHTNPDPNLEKSQAMAWSPVMARSTAVLVYLYSQDFTVIGGTR